jgi:FMN-dependent NADH-azoreductase
VEAEPLKEVVYLSDQLIDDLLLSDSLVIAGPMWNFGIPSSLKAWIDHVLRAGKTFNYAGIAVEELAKGKKAIMVRASGGIFREGPWKFLGFREAVSAPRRLRSTRYPMVKRPLKPS